MNIAPEQRLEATKTFGAFDEACLELERRGQTPPDFGRWIDGARPDMRWDYPHMRYIQKRFDMVTAGEIDNLALMISGRHGKTEHVKSYAVYLLKRDPTTSILFGTYNYAQANKLGGEIQDLGYKLGLQIVGTRPSNSLWYVKGGGGLQCVGVGTDTASLNPDYILIDDPIGSRFDAESSAYRDRAWDWLTTDMLARMVPGMRVVFSMPRWHMDDPMGRLLDRQSDMWTVIDMPGRALEKDQLGRAEGELLWPEMRGEDFHQKQRATVGAYGYASFIQCRPTPREGAMFKWDWWGKIDEIPAVGRMVRYWDTAGTAELGGTDPDYTVGALLCRMTDGRTAVVDVTRFRESVAVRDAKMVEVARSDVESYPGRVVWWIETETGIGGRERMEHLLRAIQAVGMAVRLDPRPRGSKAELAQPMASKAEAGNVVLCPGEWRDAFRLEHGDFPGGNHDDQVDATRGADAKLSAPVNSGVVQTIHM